MQSAPAKTQFSRDGSYTADLAAALAPTFMSQSEPDQSMRLLKAFCAMIACGAIVLFAFRLWADPLWLDELLTLILVQADSLPKLWAGIVSGIDGNPPLYLTIAWLMAHALPSSVSIAAWLKAANLLMAAAATVILYRVSRRAASALAAWMGAFLFVTLNDNLAYVAFELRTYALYFLLAAFAVLFQQRLNVRHRPRDIALLGIIYAALALSHTFGIVYVGCIALAGFLSRFRGGWQAARPTVLAVLPALLAFAGWLPFFIQQSTVGRPYMWIAPPELSDLLETLFASKPSMWIALIQIYCLAGAAIWSADKHGSAQIRAVFHNDDWQPCRFMALLVAGILGFTLLAWTVSVLLFPLFVPRYFTPQLIVSFALNVAFCEWLVRIVRHREPVAAARFAAIAVVIPTALLCAVLLSRDRVRRPAPCADGNGAFFETGFVVRGDLPVIADSPHVFLPRATYALQAAAYRFPLDWDVVLAYPQRSRGNATDFHIMQSLRAWAGKTSIMSTEEILRTYPQFLAIEISDRAWLHNLRNTRDTSAEKLAEVTSPDGGTCTLWKVTSTTARR